MDSLMEREYEPYLGIPQPHIGTGFPLVSVDVRRTSKSQMPGSVIRGVLAQNLVALRDRKWAHLPNATKRNAALAALCKPTSPSQIHRIASQLLGTSIDLLERLAQALEVRPQDLITPYFASSVLPTLEQPDGQDGLHSTRSRVPAAARKA